MSLEKNATFPVYVAANLFPPDPTYKYRGGWAAPWGEADWQWAALCHRSKAPTEPIVPPGCSVYQQKARCLRFRILVNDLTQL